MSKLFERAIALILVLILTTANLFLIGGYTYVYALSDEQLSRQDAETNHRNVEFNAYFNGDSHSQIFEINSEEAILYLKINVMDAGYLENGVIEFQNANFKLKDGISNENIQSVDVNNNRIVLNKVNNGSDITIELPIEILKNENVSTDYFNKETVTRFTGTYVDGEGDEYNIEKEVSNRLSWSATTEAELKAENTKYIPYAENGNLGVLVQTKISSNIKDATLPIKTTNIEVTAPTINSTYPTSATVVALKTEATNGKTDGLDFGNANYTYNAEDGKVSINTSNLEDSISWKNGVDEYLVTYFFEGEEIYGYATENGIDSTTDITSNITVYGGEELSVTNNVNIPVQYTEKLNNVTDFSISAPATLSKGYIYTNYSADNKVETEYTNKYTVTIPSAKLISSLQFTQSVDKFLTAEDEEGLTTIGSNNYAYNKRIEISQAIFNKILGEDGVITVKDNRNNVLGTINKDTTVENGVYVLDLSEQNNNRVIIETTAPITEGQLELNIVKAIKGEIDYSKDQMKNFSKMEMGLTGKANETSEEYIAQTELKEPETKVDLEISKADLTTVLKNEDVEIRAILDSSSEYNALFEKPTLRIVLPSSIKEVNLKSANILLENGLKIDQATVTDENGRKVINVTLKGTQTDYSINAEYKGPIIVLNTDLTLDNLAPSATEAIEMQYVNGNEYATKAEGTVKREVNIVAPNGIVTANGIENYKEGEGEVQTISDEAQTVEIETYSEARTATVSGTIINNFSNNINNVKILGRIPAEGNKRIDESSEMGSNLTTPMASDLKVTGIDSSNYTVYYSENIDATNNLEDNANGWTTERTANSRSYLIDFANYEMKTGTKAEFSYDISIPANMTHNNSTYEMYKVYYNNVTDIGTIAESKNSAVVGMTTGQGPELTAELSSSIETIREGQIVKMTAKVQNVGEVNAENVKLTVSAPLYTKFVSFYVATEFKEEAAREKTLDVGNLEPGQTREVSYYLKVNDNTIIDRNSDEYINMSDEEKAQVQEQEGKYPKEVTTAARISATDLDNPITSETSLSIQDGSISIEMIGDAPENETLSQGRQIEYDINIYNISSSENLSNVVASIELPRGISYNSAIVRDSIMADNDTTDGVNFNSANNTLQVSIPSMEIQKNIHLVVTVEDVDQLAPFMTTVTAAGGEEHYSNIVEYNAEKPEIEITELTSSPRYVKEGENVTYKFQIINKGTSYIRNVKITDELPEELTFVRATYTVKGQEAATTTLQDGKVVIDIIEVEPEETIDVEIIARAGLLPDTNDKEIQNQVSVSATNLEKITSNQVTNIIEYYEGAHTGNGADPVNPSGRYKITGTAWLDANQNGEREGSEELLSGIEVILMNKDRNSIVKDPDTNNEMRTTTGSDGKYEFSNVPYGDYIVLFAYDASRYSLTKYQEQGVDSSFNSDAIDVNITIDGERRIAGITDILTVTNGNIRDIDIGLYTSEKFDLRLDKYVSKITLTTPTIGTNTYNYDNEDLAKIEVLGQNLGKSDVAIEYKIVVTNEGAVPGYVRKIVDYLPEGVRFNTELNEDWFLSENGNIYNTSLENTKIEPGESKEVTLVISHNITKVENLNNSAEIYEAYNEQGLADIDSTPGNKVETEDDMSKADVILSLVTGGTTIMIITLILGVTVLLAFGVYEIKRRVLKKK